MQRGTPYPGARTTLTGNHQGTYPIPPRNSFLKGFPSAPSPSLVGKRAAIQSRDQLATAMGLAMPPSKRPKGIPNPNPPITRANLTAGVGRNAAVSFFTNPIGAAAQAISQWQPGDISRDFQSVARFVEAGKGELEFAQYLRGQVVFNHKAMFSDNNQKTTLRVPHPLTGRYFAAPRTSRIRPQGTYRLMSLPVLNYYLRLDDYARVENVRHPWLTPEKVLEQYALDGVVRTDAHESKSASYRNVNTMEYTVTTWGRDPDATNIWGAVAQQQPVYLIVKRLKPEQVPQEYITNANDGAPHRVPPPRNGGVYHPNPIQIVPWTDAAKREPTLQDLSYFDDASQAVRFGVALRVGWANFASNASNRTTVAQAWYNATTMSGLPKIDLCVNMRDKGAY